MRRPAPLRHPIALVLAACLALGLLTACDVDPQPVSISRLLIARQRFANRRIQVAGVVVDAPGWTESGAVFRIADSDDRSKVLRVIYEGARPPTPRPSTDASATWVGAEVVFSGTFDGDALSSNDMTVMRNGPYRSRVSTAPAP